MLTRKEFNLLQTFAYLVLDALKELIAAGIPSYLPWNRNCSNFINSLAEYGKEYVPLRDKERP